jgi:hypothetical protein
MKQPLESQSRSQKSVRKIMRLAYREKKAANRRVTEAAVRIPAKEEPAFFGEATA